MNTTDLHEFRNDERTFEVQPKATPEKQPPPVEQRVANLQEAMHILENVARMLGHKVNIGDFVQPQRTIVEEAASKIVAQAAPEAQSATDDPHQSSNDVDRARQSINEIFKDAA